MGALEQWQQNVAHNLANVPVPGFKGQGLAMRAVNSGTIPMVTESDFDGVLKGLSPKNDSRISFADGNLVNSGETTHVAIQGEGFFELESGRGKPIYTRDGTFHVDAENYLVNKNGLRVRGEAGPISVPAASGQVTIDKQGNVLQGGVQVNKLALVEITGREQLTPVPGGFVVSGGANIEVKPMLNASVASGFYESSNVQTIEQMIQLIQISRAYESNQKVVQSFDTQLGNSIQSLSST